MSFSVTVLGSQGIFATEDRAASGYLLRFGDNNLWLDAGAGTWRNLLSHIDWRALGGVILTHEHPDHTTDVFQAFHARRYGTKEKLPPLPLWAPAPTLAKLEAFSPKIVEAFDMRSIEAGATFQWCGAVFSFHRMDHSGIETVGVRVESQGATFAYSADTGPGADFPSLVQDADLFICEASFQESDEKWEGHMSASQAAEVAADLGVKHLVLTHLPVGRDLGLSLTEAPRDAKGTTVRLADDGQVFEVGA
ncbi:MAG: MBL fold metallo-hydrolase [Actinomycetota bacterium]